jgi:GR25 family glycosyltransferase involved in LPS biosynthesis
MTGRILESSSSLPEVYVISLPQDQARYEDFLAHHKEHAPFLPPPIKVEGIYGKDLTPHERARVCRSAWYRSWVSSSMLGCGLSHLKALRAFLDSPRGCTTALILEDDARIRPDLTRASSWASMVQRVQEDGVDLVHLGGHETVWGYQAIVRGRPHVATGTERDTDLVPVWWWSTTAAYLLSRRGASRILEALEGGRMVYHVDTVYQGLLHTGVVRGGCVASPWFLTRAYESHNSSTTTIVGTWIVRTLHLNPDVVHLLLTMSMIQVPVLGITLTTLMLFQGILLALVPNAVVGAMALLFSISLSSRDNTTRLFLLQALTILILGKRARVFWVGFWLSLFLVFGIIFWRVSRGRV